MTYGTPQQRERSALLSTRDGIHYETVTDSLLALGGWPTEARVRFADDGTALCLHRRDGEQNTAYLGTAKPPYQEWTWHDLGMRLGGPNFIQIPNGAWIGAGRLYDGGARTEIVQLKVDQGAMVPLLRLPSGGDTSYPGMVWHDDQLWVSYYASHEGKTSIYLARVEFVDEAEKNETNGIIPIGNRRELFVDQHLIEDLDHVELRLHAPRAAESVLTFDESWEGAFCGYVTIMRDGDLLRMYYRGLPVAGRDGTSTEVTCYAESQDGIRWHKPHLGLYEVEGTRENNVVLAGQTPASHNFSPFLDAHPNVAEDQRYKALGGTSAGLIAFTSADGLRWKRLQAEPVITKGKFDSQNVSFYSVAEERYVCYFRTWTETDYGGFRTVSRTTSKDFKTWTDPTPMSFGDTPFEHLYTNQTWPYFRAPHIYVGIAARFMPGRRVLSASEAQRIGVDPRYYHDCSDAVLLTSRGGDRYDRTFMESLIRPGLGLQNWVSRTNYPALGIVPTGDDEISVYLQKNYGQSTSHLQRYVFRTDGFVSLHAGYSAGEMLLKPLKFSAMPGVRLGLNYSTSAAGEVLVELQDVDGHALPGFSLKDCEPLIGDRIDGVVTWKSEANLADWAGQPVRIRMVLKDADVYSFQFR